MEPKRILVLANSYKHHARCVAGRELDANGSPGPWVRPISVHGDGELFPLETLLTNGRQVAVRQYVSIPLLRYANDPLQPENWIIRGASNWIDLDSQCPEYSLKSLVETPPNLWNEPGGFNDSVSHHYLRERPPEQSLYVIRPENFRVRMESRDEKRKCRAVFKYGGFSYNFSITDPVFLRNYTASHGQNLSAQSPLPCGDRCLLCVSLGSIWQGKHFKLAATLFENLP